MTEKYTVLTFSSGLRAIHRRTSSPAAYMCLTIGAGTRDEKPTEHGVAHLVEHLLFKGTKNHRAYYINSALDSQGGELNAFTSKEETTIHATCPKEYVAKGAALMVDMVMNSNFKDKDIAKEKDVIADEINSYKDSPSDLIFDEFEELLFEGNGLGRNILGSKRTLNRVKREDLLNFCATNYLLPKMIFALSSSHTEAEFKRLTQRVFGELSQETPDTEMPRTAPTPVPHFEVEMNKRVNQNHVIIGGYAPSVYDPKRLTAALLLNIVGGPTALSRMNLSLREKHALTYNTEGGYYPLCDAGLFTLYFSCEQSKAPKAEKLLREILHQLSEQELSPNKLKAAKRQFIGQLLLSSENSESVTIALAKSMLLFGECEALDTIIQKIESITPQELRSVAAEMFAPSNLYKLCYL